VSVLRKRLGDAGERVARSWYEQRGFRSVATNWRCPQGEVDLVVVRAGLLVFCEVKTRRSTGFGDPREAITPAKLASMRKVAGAFLAAEHEGDAGRSGSKPSDDDVASWSAACIERIRLDVACVYWGEPPRVQVLAGVGE